ncbi:MAG: hypothetical protein Q9186_004906 [Xanthomendoza sp. 1 TL-2023]
MSVPRLTFLYPQFLRTHKYCEPVSIYQPLRDSTKTHCQKAGISTTSRRKQETFPQRYGPATESQLPPPSQPPVPNDLGRDKSLAGVIEKEVKPPAPKQEEKRINQIPLKESTSPKDESKNSPATQSPSISEQNTTTLDASESHSKEPLPTSTTLPDSPTTNPLDTVLHRSTPSDESTPSEEKPPHLQAPPYIHHFDTFTTTLSLQTGGFTPPQSIILMKAVRGLLARNLSLARAGLVSKSDVENETYLFRAACSELRTEISNLRKTSHRTSSTQLAHLKHETEILGQRLTQESSALKEEMRGMLNDRRMAVRMEQQGVEQKIQELNYKITVALNSDSKSEVEGLRWVLTRRAAMAIGCMAVLILGSLRYITYKLHIRDQEQKIAAEKAKANTSSSSGSGGGGGGGNNFTVPSREMSTQTMGAGADTEAMLANVSRDGSPAYVSLG